MKIVLATGGFDPLHSGHINYFLEASKLGDKLVVGLNSDAWLTRKKGRAFMPIDERTAVISNLRVVDETMPFNDDTNNSVNCIYELLEKYPNDEIIFVNGGDRNNSNVPEQLEFANNKRVSFIFGVGGEHKQNSSRWILEEWKAPKTIRDWGQYRIIHEVHGTKVKELTIDPGKSLSMQKHASRHEFWHVTEGRCLVDQSMPSGYDLPTIELTKHQQLIIPVNDWHRIRNPFDEPCKIVEIQYGDECAETDIVRR